MTLFVKTKLRLAKQSLFNNAKESRKRLKLFPRWAFRSWWCEELGSREYPKLLTTPIPSFVWVSYHLVLGPSSVQSLSRVRLCDPMNHSTPGLPVHHHLPKFTQTHVHRVSDAIQPSHPLLSLLLLPPIPPSIRVFSSESTLRMRWPKYWSFSFSIIPSKEIPGLISFRMDWLDLLAVQGTQMGKPLPKLQASQRSN